MQNHNLLNIEAVKIPTEYGDAKATSEQDGHLFRSQLNQMLY